MAPHEADLVVTVVYVEDAEPLAAAQTIVEDQTVDTPAPAEADECTPLEGEKEEPRAEPDVESTATPMAEPDETNVEPAIGTYVTISSTSTSSTTTAPAATSTTEMPTKKRQQPQKEQHEEQFDYLYPN